MTYKLVASHQVSADIRQVCQDQGLVIMSLANDSLLVYDWQMQRQIDEWQNFVLNVSQIMMRGEGIVVGTKEGSLILRYKANA